MTSSDETVNRIKTGASLLTNGGTLTSEPCPRCNGVQVRMGDKTICINCGNEINNTAGAQKGLEREREGEREQPTQVRRSAVLISAASIIEEKIAILASEIRLDNDLSIQRQKLELLERYLGILEKTKSLLA
jgi:uncharacterized Zn finger protein (UPF0148 family)